MICCPFQTFWLVLPGSPKYLTSTAQGKMSCTLLLPITTHNITSMNTLQCKTTCTRSTHYKNYIHIYYWCFTTKNHVFAIIFNFEPVVKDSFFFCYTGQIAKDAISHHVFLIVEKNSQLENLYLLFQPLDLFLQVHNKICSLHTYSLTGKFLKN